MVPLFYLIEELLPSVHRRVDAAPDLVLCRTKKRGDLRQGRVPDDHEIDVACGPFLAGGDGAVDEGEVEPWSEGFDGVLYHVNEASRFQEDFGERFEDG